MDIDFKITFEEFNKGNSPVAHLDTKTFIGDKGQATEMRADIISKPSYLTQSPGLANLTNGTEAGAVSELIRFILEQPTDANGTITYALGTSKLFKLTANAVSSGGSPSWPQAVTSMTEGESLVRLNSYLYGFFNKASAGEIMRMDLTTESITHNWGSATDLALEKAAHPAAVKEDIILFGNGRYVGAFIEGAALLDVQKLDFGAGAEVVDIVFNANAWWIAVNYGERRSQIYIYDGSAISNILSDEAGIGAQKIGFLYVINGVLYVAFKDNTSGTFSIGYLSGRALNPLRYFSGSLPNHRQKTLYKNTILFVSNSDVWSFGAPVNQLPAQIGALASGGYSTIGAIAAPFGTPLIASTNGTTGFRLAKFSGYSTNSIWKSVLADLTTDRRIGNIHTVIVYTKPLVGSASAIVRLEGDQGSSADNRTSSDLVVTGTGVTRHIFTNIGLVPIEDVRAIVDYSSSDTTNDCPIRKITLLGNFTER